MKGKRPQNRARSGSAATQFKAGTSGNPGGRPKVLAEVREAARAHTEEAINVLVELMRSADKQDTRLRAAEALLDRGYGKPTQPITSEDERELSKLTPDELAAKAKTLAAKVEAAKA